MDEKFMRDYLYYKVKAEEDYRKLVRKIRCPGCAKEETCKEMPKDCFVEKEVKNG